MKQYFRGLPSIILLTLIVAVVQIGCRENTLINSRVSPSNNKDSVYSVSLPCITHTYYDDSAITSIDVGAPVYEGVGTMIDPFFGEMTGATFFQVIFQDPDTNVYTGSTIDSAVLILPYSGFTYGSTAVDSMATYQVFYMADTLSVYNTYYGFSNKPIDASFPLSAPTTFNIAHLGDSILVSGPDHSALHIKLNLPVLLNHLYPALEILTNSTNPTQDFLNAFNGICVRAANNRNFLKAMPYFELDGVDNYSEAGILVYYHPTGITVDSDNIEPYYFNTGICGHFNAITKSYSHYPVNALIHSTQANDPVVALQNQPGASIDVVVTGIKSLPAGIISKAELQFSVLPAYTDTSLYMSPESLTPLGVASATYHPLGTTYAGELYTVYDRYPIAYTSPLIVMDGTEHYFYPRAGGLTTNTFTIDIPREVIASKAANNDTLHYHINGTQDFYGAFHMIAGGGSYGANGTSDTIYRAKLIVVYSALTNH